MILKVTLRQGELGVSSCRLYPASALQCPGRWCTKMPSTIMEAAVQAPAAGPRGGLWVYGPLHCRVAIRALRGGGRWRVAEAHQRALGHRNLARDQDERGLRRRFPRGLMADVQHGLELGIGLFRHRAIRVNISGPPRYIPISTKQWGCRCCGWQPRCRLWGPGGILSSQPSYAITMH